jgi:WD40 repeat protein
MAERERLIRVLEPGLGDAMAVAWSPDGTRLALGGDRGIVVLTCEGKKLWTNHERSRVVWSVAWSPDGRRIASGQSGFALHDATSGTVVRDLSSNSLVVDLAWSPDGSRLATARGSGDRSVHVYDGETLRELCTMSGHTANVSGVTWSPDGQTLASASDTSIRTWNANDGRRLFVGREHTQPVFKLRWSPDGRTIATPSHDGTIRLWDARSYECVAILTEGGGGLVCVAWTPDSRHIASETGKIICLWDVPARRCIARLLGRCRGCRGRRAIAWVWSTRGRKDPQPQSHSQRMGKRCSPGTRPPSADMRSHVETCSGRRRRQGTAFSRWSCRPMDAGSLPRLSAACASLTAVMDTPWRARPSTTTALMVRAGLPTEPLSRSRKGEDMGGSSMQSPEARSRCSIAPSRPSS